MTPTPHVVVSKPLVPSHSRILDEKERAHYWSALLTDWHVPGHRVFPGCHPMSLSKHNIHLLEEARYLISLKSDGLRYVLYLTVRPETVGDVIPVALLIDRAGNMYEVDVMAPEEYFTHRTVLEGELVWRQPSEDELLFLVFDCIRTKGVSMLERPFATRLKEAQRLVRFSEDISKMEDAEQKIDETDSIVLMQFEPRVRMRGKTFISCKHAMQLWEDRRECQHRVDGIILQRETSTYVCGTATSGQNLKWKKDSTVDLTCVQQRLYTSDGPVPQQYKGYTITLSNTSRISPRSEQEILEYLITLQNNNIVLFAVKRRPDKVRPNSNYVITATFEDVLSSVTPKEIADVYATA